MDPVGGGCWCGNTPLVVAVDVNPLKIQLCFQCIHVYKNEKTIIHIHPPKGSTISHPMIAGERVLLYFFGGRLVVKFDEDLHEHILLSV